MLFQRLLDGGVDWLIESSQNIGLQPGLTEQPKANISMSNEAGATTPTKARSATSTMRQALQNRKKLQRSSLPGGLSGPTGVGTRASAQKALDRSTEKQNPPSIYKEERPRQAPADHEASM